MKINRRSRTYQPFHFLLVIFFVPFILSGQPTFSKVFTPDVIGPGSVTTLIFTIDNTVGSVVTDLAFTDNLPPNVTLATPANPFTSCTNAVVTALDGGTSISLTDGKLGVGSSCFVRVLVTGNMAGTHMNVSGDLTSSGGNSGTATDDLTITATLPGFSKSFAPSTVLLGERSTLTFTIDNMLNSFKVGRLDFTDILPIGMVIANPPNASTDCVNILFPDTELTAVAGTGIITLYANGTTFFPGFEVLPIGATCSVTVDVVAASAGMLKNVSNELLADFVPSGKAGNILNVTRTDLAIQKNFTDDPVPPGGTVDLEFTITNFDRDFTATDVAFTDNLGMTLMGLAPGWGFPSDPCGAGSSLSFGSETLGLTGGTIAPGASCTFSLTLDIPTGATPGVYPNTTSAVTATIDGSPVVGNMANENLYVSAAPILTKEFTDDPVGTGGSVTLEFTIENTSTAFAATDISFLDELTNSVLPSPISVTLPPVPNPPCGIGSSLSLVNIDSDPERQGLSLTGGILAEAGMPGSSCTFEVTIDIPNGMPAGTYVNTSGPITATVDGATRIGKPATDDLVIVAAPSLVKSFTDDPVDPGSSVTLEFTITHDALAIGDATGITFTDDLNALSPAIPGLVATGLPITDLCGAGNGTLTGSSGDTQLTFSGGTLMPGESCSFNVTLAVPMMGAIPGAHTNQTGNITATVSGVTATGNPASDDLQIAGLTLIKEFKDDPVIPGETATLKFTLENNSPTLDFIEINFTDDLDNTLSGLTVVSPLPSTMDCGAGSTFVQLLDYFLIFSEGELLKNESCSFEVSVLVPLGTANGPYSNITSNVTATSTPGVIVSNPALDDLIVNDVVLELSKSFVNNPVAPGVEDSLEFTITNLHDEAISNITFTDDLDAALSGLMTTGLPKNNVCGIGSSISGSSILTFIGGSLAGGASCTFRVAVQVPSVISSGTTITNTTSSVSGLAGTLPVTGTAASADLTINVLTFSKVFDNMVVKPGEMTKLKFTIENLSSGTSFTDLQFSDDLNAVIPGMEAMNVPQMDVCGMGSLVMGSSFITATGITLGPAEQCNIELDVYVPLTSGLGTFTNTTSDLLQLGLTQALPATADLIVEPPPLFTKTDEILDDGQNLGKVDPGEKIKYTVKLKNQGNISLEDLILQDPNAANVMLDNTSFTSTPVAIDDKFFAPLGGTISGAGFDVSLNDFDLDGDPLTYIYTSPLPMPAKAIMFTFNPDGTFSYTHDGSGAPLLDNFTYEVSDGQSVYKGEVSICMIPNLPPVFTSMSTQSVDENQAFVMDLESTDPAGFTEAAGELLYSITGGADKSKFVIDPNSGALSFNFVTDYENPMDVAGMMAMDNMYEVEVTVQNIAGINSLPLALKITVLDTEPRIENQNFSILETAVMGQTVGPVNLFDDVNSVKFSITLGNTLDEFAIDMNTGIITVYNAAALVPGTTYMLTVDVTDDMGTTVDQGIMTIEVVEIPSDAQMFTIPEDIANTDPVGTVTFSLSDDISMVTFMILPGVIPTGNDGVFTIDLNTGEITVLDNSTIDFETTPSYSLEVKVTGPSSMEVIPVVINITNVNDGPVLDDIEASALTFLENASAIEISSTLTVADVDDINMESGTIKITGNFQNAEDILADNGSVPAGITVGAFNTLTGEITLTGTASLADYQTAFRAITYRNSSNTPNTATRTISFTVNDGDFDSNIETRDITIISVNDEPSFTVGADQTVLENAGAQTVPNWATNLYKGPADESTQTLSFNITGNTNTALFSAGPAVDANGQLTYTPAASGSGTATISLNIMDNGGTANGGDDTSPDQMFTITVTPVNDEPSFTKGANQMVLEDAGAQIVAAWATSLSAGPANESGQTLSFNITGNTNTGLFSAGPTVDASGQLSYTPADDANGIATISLNIMDDGGTANGGDDTSADQMFTITVTAVNDEPSFTKGSDQTVLEDAGAQTVAGWATGLSKGPANESTQTLSFNITGNTNTALFSAGPAVDPNGQLTYTATASGSGTATISLNIMDDGGTANGGDDTSVDQMFTITITGVNDEPSFTVGADQSVSNNAGAQTVAGWATSLSAGPANESSQALSFNITGNTNTAIFSAGPAVDATGQLTYTPAASGSGTATISLNIMDDGGTANGGDDTSPDQSFTITVSPPTNTAPTATNDSYSTLGNTELLLTGGTATKVGMHAVEIVGDLRTNDSDSEDAKTSLTVSLVTGPTALEGVLDLKSDGTFSFIPAPGKTGNVTFTYKVTDTGGLMSSNATVTITIMDMIWYVKNTNAAPGTGTSADPYMSLASADAETGSGTTIFVYSGSGNGLNTGVTLDDNQDLCGQGVPFVVDDPNSMSTITLVPMGTAPVLSNPSGDVVTLGSNNVMKGVILDPTASAGIIGMTTNTLKLENVEIKTEGGSNASDGIELTNPTGVITFKDVTITSGAGVTSGTAFKVNGGDAIIDFQGTGSITQTGGMLIDIQNTTGGSVDIGAVTGTYTIRSTSASSHGINLDMNAGNISIGEATINTSGSDAVDAQGNSSVITLKGLDINNTAAANGGGVNLGSNTSATFNFTKLDILTTGAGDDGINADNALPMHTINITGTGNKIIVGGAEAVDINGGILGVTFDMINASPTSTRSGIELDDISGSFTVNGGTITKTGSDGAAVDIGANTDMSGGSATINIAANLISNAQRSVLIQELDGGSVTFSGSVTDNDEGISVQRINNTNNSSVTFSGAVNTTTAANKGVDLGGSGSNTKATINFTGGLIINTTSGTGFTAKGGTLNITGASNMITSSAGKALEIDGVTIGANDVTFASISSTNSSNEGLKFNNVSNAGTFIVSGTTTVNQATNEGIEIDGGSAGYTFGTVNITNRRAEGIDINGTSGTLTFGATTINSTPATTNEDGIRIASTTGGSVSFTSATIDNNKTIISVANNNAIEVYNNIADVTFTLVDIDNVGDHGIYLGKNSVMASTPGNTGLVTIGNDGSPSSINEVFENGIDSYNTPLTVKRVNFGEMMSTPIAKQCVYSEYENESVVKTTTLKDLNLVYYNQASPSVGIRLFSTASTPGISSDANFILEGITDNISTMKSASLEITTQGNTGASATAQADLKIDGSVFGKATGSGLILVAMEGSKLRTSIGSNILNTINIPIGGIGVESISTGGALHLNLMNNHLPAPPSGSLFELGISIHVSPAGSAISCMNASGNSNGSGSFPNAPNSAFIFDVSGSNILNITQLDPMIMPGPQDLWQANNGGLFPVQILNFGSVMPTYNAGVCETPD